VTAGAKHTSVTLIDKKSLFFIWLGLPNAEFVLNALLGSKGFS
jgi:hypothetical protein